jgi:hypothetical protein
MRRTGTTALYRRFGPQPLPLAERFWEKVDTSAGGVDGCWPWIAKRRRDGYGCFFINGGKATRAAHRVAYELATGEQLGDLQIDHRCHNKACCNPLHLRPVTNKQNSEHLQGAHCDSKTGIRGVTKAGQRWGAQVKHNWKQYWIGTFDTIEEAAEAARAKRLELFTHNDLDRIGGDSDAA